MAKYSDNTLAALFMMGSMAGFTFNDACMKTLSGTVPLFQLLLLRGLLTLVMMIALAHWQGVFRLRLPRRDWALIALRTAAEAGAAYFFLTALFRSPFANVNAVLQALPLTITLASAVFLGEKVGWRRLSAIIIGFFGVMLIVRPSADGFDSGVIYVLVAVVFVTVRDLAARRLSSETPSMMVAISAAGGVTLFAAFGSLGIVWTPLDGHIMLLVSGAAFFCIGWLYF